MSSKASRATSRLAKLAKCLFMCACLHACFLLRLYVYVFESPVLQGYGNFSPCHSSITRQFIPRLSRSLARDPTEKTRSGSLKHF